MKYSSKAIIDVETYQYYKRNGIPYTGFIKGMGYTTPCYFSFETGMSRKPDYCVKWSNYVATPLFCQVVDDSPEAVFLSMGYSSEEIVQHLIKKNGDGRITVTSFSGKSIIVPEKDSRVIVNMIEKNDSYVFQLEVYTPNGEKILDEYKIIGDYFCDNLPQALKPNDDKGVLDKINTGIGALSVGIDGKNEIIDYAIRNKYGYSWKQFNKLSNYEKLTKEYNAIGRTGIKYLNISKKITGLGIGVSTVISSLSIIKDFMEGKPVEKKSLKLALDIVMSFVPRFIGPWGFAISSIYYIVDTATDGFGYFNE